MATGESDIVWKNSKLHWKQGDNMVQTGKSVVGATGAGKSTLFNALPEIRNVQLESCTLDFGYKTVSIPNQPGNRIIVVLDPPGFEDLSNDLEVQRYILVWFASPYTKKMMLGGVIYLHNNAHRYQLITNLLSLSHFRLNLSKEAIQPLGIPRKIKQTSSTGLASSRLERHVREKFLTGVMKIGCSVYRVPGIHQSAWHMDLNMQRPASALEVVTKRMVGLPNRMKGFFGRSQDPDQTQSVVSLAEAEWIRWNAELVRNGTSTYIGKVPPRPTDEKPRPGAPSRPPRSTVGPSQLYPGKALPPRPNETSKQHARDAKSGLGTDPPHNINPSRMYTSEVPPRPSASSKQHPTDTKSGPDAPTEPTHNTDPSRMHTENAPPRASTSSKQHPTDETSGSGVPTEPLHDSDPSQDAGDAQNADREEAATIIEAQDDNEVQLQAAEDDDNQVAGTKPSSLANDIPNTGGMFHGSHDFNMDNPVLIESVTTTQTISQVANIVNSGNHICNHIDNVNGNPIPGYITAGASVVTAGAALAIANSVIYKEPQPTLVANVGNPTAMSCGEPEFVRELEERCPIPLNDFAATAALVECLRRYKYDRTCHNS